MEGLNKFKVITVVVIFLFAFTVAAIYSNTKDITTGKMQIQTSEEKEQLKSDLQSDIEKVSTNSNDIEYLTAQIENLNKRIDELSGQNSENNNSSSGLSCKIYGTVIDNTVVQLSSEAALEEAKNNDKELVLTCSF